VANKISSLTLQLIDDVSKPARSVEKALADAGAKIKSTAAAMGEDSNATDRLRGALGKLSLSKTDIEAVSRAWQDYTKVQGLAADSSEWTKAQIGDVRQWETQTISSVRAVIRERDAETRAMRNAAIEQANILRKQGEEQATVLREQARKQAEAATQRRELTKGVAGGLGGGLLSAFVGGATLEGIREAAGLGMTLDQRLVQLSSSGATAQQIADSRAKYREFTKTHPGVLEADWIKSRTEAQTIAPDAPDEMTELGARFQTAMRAAGRPLGEDDFQNVMRMMDELKNNTPEQRRNFLDQMAKIQQKYHGTVPLGTLLSAVQNLRSAKFSLSDDFIGKYFPTLVQSMGEQGGTAIMTAFSNYVGGHMTHSELKNLAADGFVNNSDLMRLKNGEIKGTRPGAKLFEEDLLESNPFKWANDFHDEFMKRKGATEESFTKFIAALPRNMGSLIGEFVQHRSRYERDAENQNQPGLNADTSAELAKNPAAAADALRVSFEHLAESIAAPTLQALGPAMVTMATEVQKAGNYFGSLNQTLVALGGGVAAMAASYAGLKALFGVGGGIFGGFGLKSSAIALDESAAQLTAAAIAIRGGAAADALGHGPGRSPSSLRGRTGLAAGGAAAASRECARRR
jgi:hypothetical protein